MATQDHSRSWLGLRTPLYNNSVTEVYDLLFTELADKRTNDWFLLGDPMPALSMLLMYHYFCQYWGPRYMINRKPYNLSQILVVYNLVQVVFSTWFFFEALEAGWWTKYSWKCQPVDFSLTPAALREARDCYLYFLAKLTELLDTVFFVLRKKERQISFLHLYHHTVMPIISWMCVKYYPGGHGTFIGLINTFVHIIMYSYYLLSAMGPGLQKYLWWKKYITTLQMAQFCIAFLHSAQLLYYDCEYPRITLILILPNAIFFYYLFNDFYSRNYVSELRAERDKQKSLKSN